MGGRLFVGTTELQSCLWWQSQKTAFLAKTAAMKTGRFRGWLALQLGLSIFSRKEQGQGNLLEKTGQHVCAHIPHVWPLTVCSAKQPSNESPEKRNLGLKAGSVTLFFFFFTPYLIKLQLYLLASHSYFSDCLQLYWWWHRKLSNFYVLKKNWKADFKLLRNVPINYWSISWRVEFTGCEMCALIAPSLQLSVGLMHYYYQIMLFAPLNFCNF